MTLAKAKAYAKAKVKHIYSTGVIYDNHLWLSKYFYSKGHWWLQSWDFKMCESIPIRWTKKISMINTTGHIRHQCRKTTA